MSSSYIQVLSERAAVSWILSESRTAFSEASRPRAACLAIGDELFLYTTRGCFHNPTRHRGRIMGRTRVSSAVSELAEPVSIAGRYFTTGCDLEFELLAQPLDGVEIGPLAPKLSVFASREHWAAPLRRSVIKLSPSDAAVLRQQLELIGAPPDAVRQAWIDLSRTKRPDNARW